MSIFLGLVDNPIVVSCNSSYNREQQRPRVEKQAGKQAGERTDSFGRKLAEQVRNMVKWSHQQTHSSLERRSLSCRWMTARRDEHLGAFERSGQGFTILCRFWRLQCFLQDRQIVTLFLFDVLRQIRHQVLYGWEEVRVGSAKILELLELLLDLNERQLR